MSSFGSWRFASVAACLTLSLAIGACGGGQEPRVPKTTATTAAVRAGSLFAPSSVWNAPLGPDASVDRSSPQLMAWLLAQIAEEQTQSTGPWIETTSYSTTVYRVPANQPTVPVTLDNHEPWAASLAAAFRAVPIPAGAQPAEGTDAEMTIWQPSTDRLWEFWRARSEPDGWHAEWGGAMENVSRSPGYYTKQSWPGAQSYWGTTATSLPVLAGTMTISELQQGQINHALAIDLPSVRADAYSWPAQRTDGRNPNPDAIPEGAHLRISPRVDIASLHLPPVAREMALAAQRYGMIVRDQTNHAVGFYAEDPTPTGSNPYPLLMNDEMPAELLAKFPWKDVEILRMELRHGTGRPAA